MARVEAVRAYNDRNVYVLGAGFSSYGGLPLIGDFLNKMRDSVEWLERDGSRAQEVQAITRVLDFRLKAASAAYRTPLDVENIEELFSLASASRGEELTRDVTLAIAATLDFAQRTGPTREIHVVRRHAPQQWSPPNGWNWTGLQRPPDGNGYMVPIYDFYAGMMGGYFNQRTPNRRDTIITFNYDLLVENALHNLGISFDYCLSADSADFDSSARCVRGPADEQVMRVLKLHGSVNWAQDKRERRLTVFGTYDDVRARPATPFLAPPTWRKILSGSLSEVWDAAIDALSTATRVIVLGYSIPETDLHFRYLLTAGLQENISLRKLLFVNLRAHDLRERLFRIVRESLEPQKIVEVIPGEVLTLFWQQAASINRQLCEPFGLG